MPFESKYVYYLLIIDGNLSFIPFETRQRKVAVITLLAE